MRDSILVLICACLRDLHPETDSPELVNPSEDTRLYGAKSPLDSLGLVMLLAEVEQRLAEEVGLDLVLADEKALSQARSPFRRVGTLTDYILERAAETSPVEVATEQP